MERLGLQPSATAVSVDSLSLSRLKSLIQVSGRMCALHVHVIHVIKDVSKLVIGSSETPLCLLDFTEICDVYLDKGP